MKDYNFWRNWISFNFMGNINNFSYCVVNAAGKSLAEYFNNQKNIALILWANIAFGFVSRLLNTFVLENVSTKIKIIVNCIIMALGLVGVALSVYVNFAFCIASIALIGIASSFGESVLLSYMKRFPAEIVNGWSSGTGIAGVSGSLFYIGMVALGLSNSKIFYIILPTVAVYGLLFFFGLKVPNASISQPINNNSNSNSKKQSSSNNVEKQSLVSKDQLSDSHGDEDGNEYDNNNNNNNNKYNSNDDNSIKEDGIRISDIYDDNNGACEPLRGTPNETKKQRYIRCAKLVWFNAVNLSLVYFFEYVASVGGADLAIAQDPNGNFFIKNAYAIFSFCYQFGVLISRSSLQFVKIKRIGILTILQGVNMVFWIIQARYQMVKSVWVLFALMVYCGLLGGASYVNVFYLILHDKKIPDEDREICVNYAALLVTLGITLASCFILVMDHTFLAAQVAAQSS